MYTYRVACRRVRGRVTGPPTQARIMAGSGSFHLIKLIIVQYNPTHKPLNVGSLG